MNYSRFTPHSSHKCAAFTLAEVFHPLRRSKKIAFTLAEVLITLGIIGVVAALTMPSLIEQHQKKSLEVATKKFYSTLSQAVRRYMADEGVDDLKNTEIYENAYNSPETTEALRKFLTKYLKVVKECDPNDACFAQNYKDIFGGAIQTSYFPGNTGGYILADGSIIRVSQNENNVYGGYTMIIVDVNGKKGPNRCGYDLWTMYIYEDGIIDECELYPKVRETGFWYGYDVGASYVREQYYNMLCRGSKIYLGCFGHFLNNNFTFDY